MEIYSTEEKGKRVEGEGQWKIPTQKSVIQNFAHLKHPSNSGSLGQGGNAQGRRHVLSHKTKTLNISMQDLAHAIKYTFCLLQDK
jgi:hypothetical protein